jgi:hypothetical protein
VTRAERPENPEANKTAGILNKDRQGTTATQRNERGKAASTLKIKNNAGKKAA